MSSIVGQNHTLGFLYSEICREHPVNDVDVLALDVTELFVRYPQIEAHMSNYNMFTIQKILKELDIRMGDEIIVIGFPQSYPLGLKHITSNLPLIRAGIIASHIGENLVDNHKESDETYRKRILGGFLVNGAIIPGSSGSPVILKPITTWNVRGQIQMQVTRTCYLASYLKQDMHIQQTFNRLQV